MIGNWNSLYCGMTRKTPRRSSQEDVPREMLATQADNLYRTVVDLHYCRDPLWNYDNLVKAAEYIESKLRSFGLQTERERFSVELSEDEFFNVVGVLNPGKSREILVTCHYDHLRNVVGADDNLSGVAVMIECARVLSESGYGGTVRFVAFTLEEYHPGVRARITESRLRNGLCTPGLLDTCLSYRSNRLAIMAAYGRLRRSGAPDSTAFREAVYARKNQLDSREIAHYTHIGQHYEKIPTMGVLGMLMAQGSQHYVQTQLENLRSIRGVINLETCGYTSRKANSQSMIRGFSYESFPTHRVENYTTGDYIFVVSDRNSVGLGTRWFESCKGTVVDLPAMLIAAPLGFDDMRIHAPDLLRSDHAPFWHEGVPAIMITDGANYRNPHYHTPGDTVDTLDFDFLEKVAKATVLTVMSTQAEEHLRIDT